LHSIQRVDHTADLIPEVRPKARHEVIELLVPHGDTDARVQPSGTRPTVVENIK